jgi:hypothetical protein
MAIGLRVKFVDGTQEQYDAVGDRAPQSPPDIKEFPVYNHMTG